MCWRWNGGLLKTLMEVVSVNEFWLILFIFLSSSFWFILQVSCTNRAWSFASDGRYRRIAPRRRTAAAINCASARCWTRPSGSTTRTSRSCRGCRAFRRRRSPIPSSSAPSTSTWNDWRNRRWRRHGRSICWWWPALVCFVFPTARVAAAGHQRWFDTRVISCWGSWDPVGQLKETLFGILEDLLHMYVYTSENPKESWSDPRGSLGYL